MPPDPTSTPGFFSQAGSFLKDVPSMLIPGENAGRIALMAWAASKGPESMLGVADYFRQMDAGRFKTVTDPEYQDYVKQLEEQNVANGMAPDEARRNAIAGANKVFVGAKGFVAPEALSAVDAAPGGPSLPDRIKMPQLPPVDIDARVKTDISKFRAEKLAEPGVEGEAGRYKIAGLPIPTALTTARLEGLLDQRNKLMAQNPGVGIKGSVDERAGLKLQFEDQPNTWPAEVPFYNAQGEKIMVPTEKLGEIVPALKGMRWQPRPDGFVDAVGLDPAYKSKLESQGSQAGKYDVPEGEAPGSADAKGRPLVRPPGMPYATWEKELEGRAYADKAGTDNQIKLDTQKREWEQGYNEIMAGLDKVVERIVPEAFIDMKIDKSMWGALKNLGGTPWQAIQRDLLGSTSGVAQSRLAGQVTQMLGRFARLYGGERGVLTEKDVERMRAVLPDATDISMERALLKIQDLRETMDEIMKRRMMSNWRPERGDRLVDSNFMPLEGTEPLTDEPPTARDTTPAASTPPLRDDPAANAFSAAVRGAKKGAR